MALTEIPSELSSTPSIVDNGNATAITIDSSENATFSGSVGIGGSSLSLTGNATPGLTVSSNGPFILLQDANNADKVRYISNNTGELQFGIVGDDGATGKTEHMRIDSSGNVGIGHDNPSYLVHADATTSTDPSYFVASSGSDFVVAMGSQNSPGVAQEAFIGTISNHDFKIKTNNTEALRITAARDMYFGQTTGSAASVGHIMQANGALFNTRDGGVVQYLRRLNSDGDIVQFNRDGTTVGSIGAYNGVPYIGYAGGAGGGILFNGASIEPTALGSSRTNGANDIGSATYRWKDIFLSGGVNFSANANAAGMTSELLDDYEEGAWTAGISAVGGNSTTVNTVHGYYTKIGRNVNIYFYLNQIDLALLTSGTYVILTGLPFQADTYSDLQWSYHRGGNDITGGYIQSASSYVYLVGPTGVEIQQGSNETITALIGSASYMTNS